jgi:hypothetical protein
MSFRTITAAFDHREHASAAVSALLADGFTAEDISLLEHAAAGDPSTWSPQRPTLWHRIVGQEVLHNDASIYRELLARGGAVVAVRVPAHEVDHATRILDHSRPVRVGNHAVPAGVALAGANLRPLTEREAPS